ncbi:MAG: DNRLRE domain-containing protein, partial [Deltaproteobacteria bacterium]|nr:DNRLRE domain-containing protein [Deltaproteobacteria bacterium]
MLASARSTPFVLAFVGLLAAAPAFATTITVQPSNQDAFIRKNFPNRIAGANPTNQRIRVQASPPNTQVWRGLVQFSLAGIPLGSTINSAVAEISAGNNASNPALVHGLHRITATWLQSAVKWNNAPAFVAAPTATAFVGTSTGFKAFTVTPDVQAAVNLCAADHGWLVKDQNETASNDQVNYVSLEDIHPAQLVKRPKLTVDFTPPPCSTNADCADANFCTTNEQCIAGACVVTPVSCDDGDPCTDDICDCASGCVNANICNDGFTCTTDICDPGTLECTNVKNDAVCNGQCSDGYCDADPDSTTVDPVTGCEITSTDPDGSACDDGEACTTTDECTGGVCGGDAVVCTPLSQCHDAGTCNPGTGVCSNPVKPNGAACNDGTLCTAPDACDGAG